MLSLFRDEQQNTCNADDVPSIFNLKKLMDKIEWFARLQGDFLLVGQTANIFRRSGECECEYCWFRFPSKQREYASGSVDRVRAYRSIPANDKRLPDIREQVQPRWHTCGCHLMTYFTHSPNSFCYGMSEVNAISYSLATITSPTPAFPSLDSHGISISRP